MKKNTPKTDTKEKSKDNDAIKDYFMNEFKF